MSHLERRDRDMGFEYKPDYPAPAELLDKEGREFIATFPSSESCRKEAERVAAGWEGIVQPFGVDIESIESKTNKVTKWEKTEGLSVWR